MSFTDPPQPPDPIRTAAAATATNVGTSVANAYLNNVNQVTPEGSLQYSQTGNFPWTDPTTNQTYNIPNFTASQFLSPSQQYIRDQSIGAKTNLAELANTQSQYMQDLLGSAFNPTASAPGGGNLNWLHNDAANYYGGINPVGYANATYGDVGQQQRALANTGQQQLGFGDPGDIDRNKVEAALFGRLDPQLQQERSQLEQRLADQGIRYGSEAYHQAMDDYNRQSTDARLAVTAAGGAEQQRMYQQALGRGQFANQAQAQNFQQALQTGTFANQAQQQAYQQEALRGQFYNAAVAQNQARNQSIFQLSEQARKSYLAEQYQARNQPINEISALLSGSQVAGPSFVNTPQQNIATTDVAGLINNRFTQDMQNFQQQNANFNSLMGGIFGMMGGMISSDRRVKENIDRVGTVFATNPDKAEADDKKLPIYQYSYKDDPSSTRHIGPMAQDVERIDPKAVKTYKGVKHIDVTRMGSILRAA